MKSSARLYAIILAASVLPLSQAIFQGCATYVVGVTERVHVTSEPVGARVFLNGQSLGPTPATVAVSRWGSHRLRIEMPGYKPLEFPLEKRFNELSEYNVFLGGVWIIVDAATGAIFRLDVPPRLPDVRAQESPQAVLPAPTEITISTTLKPDPAARRIGQLQRQ